MKDTSIANLIIPLLLLFFFAVPSLFKLLGQYTQNGRDVQKKEGIPGGDVPGPQDTRPGLPEEQDVGKGLYEEAGRTRISNKPINPRWF